MKKILLLIAIALFLINFQLAAQPKIAASEDSYDFGDIVQGNMVAHNFIFTNEGDQELKIEKVKASCGCTAASPEKDVLKPGESTAVTVKYNSAVQSVGEKRKFVYIFSNDPENPQIRVQFTANVIDNGGVESDAPSMSLDKNEYDFGVVKEGKVVDFTVNVKNTGMGSLTVKDIKTSCGCTAALMDRTTLGPGEESPLRIEFDSKNREGKVTRTVTLYSNDPVKPDQTILIYANVVEGN